MGYSTAPVTAVATADTLQPPVRRGVVAVAAPALAVRSSAGPAGQVIRFGWHFVQMAIAMEIGMLPLGWLLAVFGQADLHSRRPEAYAIAMTVSMVLPMAAWMLLRRHGWQRTAEMSAVMLLPILVLATGGVAGLLPDTAALSGMGILMWVGMLAAMLFRWRDYTHHHGGQTG